MNNLLQENFTSLAILANISSGLSFLGCIFIFWTYFTIRDLRKSAAFKMILQLAIADFGLTANGLINVQASEINHEFCEVWAYLRQHLALTTIFWPLSFSHAMYCFYTGRYKTQHDLLKAFKYYAIFSWVSPVVVSIVPIFFGAYGSGGIYCWLSSTYSNTDVLFGMSILIFYGPIVIVTCIMVFFYVQIVRFIIRNPTPESKSVVYNLFFYPLAYLVTYAIAASDRFINLEFQGQVVWLFMAHIGLQQLQGLLNAIIYGSSQKVREQVKQRMSKKKQQEPEKSDEYFQIPEDYLINNYGITTNSFADEQGNSKSPFSSLMTNSSI